MKLKSLLKRALKENPQSQPDDALVVPCDRNGNPVLLERATQVQFWPRAATALDGRGVGEVSIGSLGSLRDQFGI